MGVFGFLEVRGILLVCRGLKLCELGWIGRGWVLVGDCNGRNGGGCCWAGYHRYAHIACATKIESTGSYRHSSSLRLR
jgi:hypothetical protein